MKEKKLVLGMLASGQSVVGELTDDGIKNPHVIGIVSREMKKDPRFTNIPEGSPYLLKFLLPPFDDSNKDFVILKNYLIGISYSPPKWAIKIYENSNSIIKKPTTADIINIQDYKKNKKIIN